MYMYTVESLLSYMYFIYMYNGHAITDYKASFTQKCPKKASTTEYE